MSDILSAIRDNNVTAVEKWVKESSRATFQYYKSQALSEAAKRDNVECLQWLCTCSGVPQYKYV